MVLDLSKAFDLPYSIGGHLRRRVVVARGVRCTLFSSGLRYHLLQGPRIGLILGAGEFSTLKFKSGKLSKLPKRVEHMKIMASELTVFLLGTYWEPKKMHFPFNVGFHIFSTLHPEFSTRHPKVPILGH